MLHSDGHDASLTLHHYYHAQSSSHFRLSRAFAQALLTRLLAGVVGDIIGEEDDAGIDISAPPFKAGAITAPAELEELIVKLRERVDEMAVTLQKTEGASACKELTAFIDPIDGTREFCTGFGEQCSICIGFADLTTGLCKGGLVYRPLCPHKSYALGCKSEGFKEASLAPRPGGGDGGGGAFLVSNGGTSPFLKTLCAELKYEMRPTGGAGNKALRVLEEGNGVGGGGSSCYIQDRGVSRWDTCGPQGVLEAHGGLLCQLQPLVVSSGSAAVALEPYHYKRGGNAKDDFLPGVTAMTKYNSDALTEADLAKGAPKRYAKAAAELKPYSNGLGLVALKDAKDVESVSAAVRRAAAKDPPAFD